MDTAPWNSLEAVKLAAAFVTPLLVLILGIFINNTIKSAERSTALRSEIYKRVGEDLNSIYSYLAFIGEWKDLTPPDLIAKKRAVDKAMYTYKPFFSEELFATYETFMAEAFSTFGSAGTDAKIRSDITSADGDRRVHGKAWQENWESRFTKGDRTAQKKAYERFLNQLARDLKL